MTRSSPVFVPDTRLSATELRCAALDGELVPLGEGYVCVDAPNTSFARASSLAPIVIDTRVIISDRSAAWVWGWGPMPVAVSTCVSIAARIPSPDRRRLRAREVVIGDDERVMLGGVAVTSPVRTLVDLARHDTGDDLQQLLACGLRENRIDLDILFSALSGRINLSFVRTARQRILAAIAQATLESGASDAGRASL